jgi:hypothetical protein
LFGWGRPQKLLHCRRHPSFEPKFLAWILVHHVVLIKVNPSLNLQFDFQFWLAGLLYTIKNFPSYQPLFARKSGCWGGTCLNFVFLSFEVHAFISLITCIVCLFYCILLNFLFELVCLSLRTRDHFVLLAFFGVQTRKNLIWNLIWN